MKNIDKVMKMTNNSIINHQGGVAYEKSFEDKLIEFFSLGLLNGNFYQSQKEVLDNSRDMFEKALEVCPEFATKCAIYGNRTNSLKLIPTIWLVYLSTLEDKTLFEIAFPQIIRNPKMLHDFVVIARKGNIRQGMGRACKRVTNDWLEDRLNEYQVSRNSGKLNDIIKVTRPIPRTEEMENYYRYISTGELTFVRAEALNVVLDIMNEGHLTEEVFHLIKKHKLQLEELKHSTKNLSKDDLKLLYEGIYESLNYSALILNLVALERVFATETAPDYIYRNDKYISTTVVVETDIPDNVIEMVVDKITDYDSYRKSNMLPFALINAEKMVVTPEFKMALSKAISTMAKETFDISQENSVMVAVDTSGSMGANVTDKLSAKDIASIFGSMVKKSYTKANVYAVASTCKSVELKSQSSIFDMANDISNTDVGHGTNFERIMPKYSGEKYVIIITDSEQADDLESRWKSTTKPEGAKLIVWQLIPYGHSISKDSSVIHLSGYSDRVLGLIKNIIESGDSQKEEIEAIKLISPKKLNKAV